MTLGLGFHAAIKDTDVYGINDFIGVSKDIDIETGSPTAYVDYLLQPEARDWGIKHISVIVKRVVASVEWETDVKIGIVEVDSSQELNGKKWTIDCEVTFEDDGALSINNVEIDLSSMTVTVS